jgi:outer membrane protein assembly factor BamB
MRHPYLKVLIVWLIPVGVALVLAWVFRAWLTLPAPSFELRLPGQDGKPVGLAATRISEWKGNLTPGAGKPAPLSGSWPGFRGSQRDGVSLDPVPLTDHPANGKYPVVWSREVGEGHAGVAIAQGAVYLLDYDRAGQADVVRCLSLTDGREIWAYAYPVPIKRNHGMSRTVPALAGQYVVTLGPKGQLVCLDRETGALQWMRDLPAVYGTTIPPWYAGQCPRIDGDRVIVAPAGTNCLMTALDLATGASIWETPNLAQWAMSHASILLAEVEGVRQYIYPGVGGVAGVAAEDGALLWRTADWKISIATIPTPIQLADGRIFLSGGYNAGSAFLRLTREGKNWNPLLEKRLAPTVFGTDQQTPLAWRGHIYGVRPGGELVCLAPDGTVRWSSGPTIRFGLGPYVLADGRIWALSDTGVLRVIRAAPEQFELLFETRILEGPDAWGPLAVADGFLMARDLTRLVCLDVRESGP